MERIIGGDPGRLLACLVVVILLGPVSGCGSTPGVVSPAATVEAGKLTFQVRPVRLSAGDSASFVMIVRGPARFAMGCGQPFRLTVASPTGSVAFRAPGSGVHCDALALVTVKGGQVTTMSLIWRIPARAESGVYTARAELWDSVSAGLGSLPGLRFKIH